MLSTWNNKCMRYKHAKHPNLITIYHTYVEIPHTLYQIITYLLKTTHSLFPGHQQVSSLALLHALCHGILPYLSWATKQWALLTTNWNLSHCEPKWASPFKTEKFPSKLSLHNQEHLNLVLLAQLEGLHVCTQARIHTCSAWHGTAQHNILSLGTRGF